MAAIYLKFNRLNIYLTAECVTEHDFMLTGCYAVVERPGGTRENRHHAIDVNGGVGKAVQQKLLLCKIIAAF